MDDLQRTLRYFRLTTQDDAIRRVYVQGNLLCYITHGYYHPAAKPPADHTIKEFSPQARLRVIRFGHTVNWDKIPRSLFTTWTYPDSALPRSRDLRNKDRYLLHRGVEHIIGRRIAALWRVEYKPRQTGMFVGDYHPHWHIIWCDVGFIPYTEIRLLWNKICHSDEKIQMDFEPIWNHGKAMSYIYKYTSKVSDQPRLDRVPQLNTDGRHYGYLRKGMIPRHKVTWFRQLTEEEGGRITRHGAMLLKKLNPAAHCSFAVFGNFKRGILNTIREMGLTVDTSVP
jgi:hypothetical protein